MKQPMPRSHFAAAMATSRSSLFLAPRSIRIRLQINFRSPKVSDSHQSNRRICPSLAGAGEGGRRPDEELAKIFPADLFQKMRFREPLDF